ncbi:MAG: zinc ribbon domain-containing protein [Sedimentisphaerales bacterium]|nr:zinc ribbon domain-containing protein [Sedimentisphaerales bacterium]
MRSVLMLVIVLLVIVSPVKAADYFPLVEGNQWNYSMSNGMQMTVKVTGFAEVGSVRCAIVESDMGMQTSREYMALDSDGLKSYKAETAGQEIQYEKPVMRIKLPFVQGQNWTASINQFGISIMTMFESKGIERIKTPAGDFECIVIRSSMSMPGQPSMVSDSYYADGKGLVCQKIQAGGQEMTVMLTSSNLRPTPQTTPSPKPPAEISQTQLRCPNCKAVVDVKAKFCPQCGTPIPRPVPAAPTVCPKCGAKLPANAKFCPACGERITVPEAANNQNAEIVTPDGQRVLEKYESPAGKVMLYKPKDWEVQEQNLEHGGYAVVVMEPQETAVVVFMTFPIGEHIKDSVSLAGVCVAAFCDEIPDFKAKNINSTQDRDRTIMEVSFTEEGEKGIGHGYFFYTQRAGTVYLLLAREDLWDQLRPMMTNVASNIAYAPEGIATVTRQGMDMAAQAPIAQEQGQVLNPAAMLQKARSSPARQMPLQPAALPDQSLTMQIPQGWSIEGQKMQYVLFDNPQTRSHGMSSTSYTIIPSQVSVPGVINAPYQPPPQAFNLILQFTRSGSNLEILGEVTGEQVEPEIAKAVQRLRVQGFQVDSRILHVRYKSPTGATLRGLFSIQCSTIPMSPVWQVSIDGSWAPENEFDEWLPVYLQVGKTFRINQQWQASEMQDRFYRQRQLNRNLQNSIAESNRAFDDYMGSLQNADRSRDYISWMQSQTTLGQGTWVANNEGAEVYQTNSWGIEGPYGSIDNPAYNTTNFTGQNPWGQNQLELVNTRAEYEKYITNQ